MTPASPLFYLADLSTAQPEATLTLSGAEGRHAATVRRLRAGEQVHVSDGAGRVVTGRVLAVRGRDNVDIAVQSVSDAQAPQPTVTVVQALLTSDRGTDAVDALTEVGVDVIIPWRAARSQVRWQVGDPDAIAKWQRAAQEASKQSRRAWWPQVVPPMDTAGVATLVREHQADGAQVLVLHEAADATLPALLSPTARAVVLVVGPEGGLTAEELADLQVAGAQVAGLGPTVLRAALAGAVAAGVVLAARGRWDTATSAGMTGSDL